MREATSKLEPDECVIWLSDNVCCVLDPEDYAHFRKWKWQVTLNSRGNKAYATRMTSSGSRGSNVKIYLHKAVLERSGKKPPTAKHIIGDHQDGDSLNNRRDNLEWATVSENNKRMTSKAWHKRQMALRLL